MMLTQRGFSQAMDEVLMFNQRICVLNDADLRRTNLEMAYKSVFSIHTGLSKIYQDLKKDY